MAKSAPQSGILNRPPENVLLVALRFIGDRTRSNCVATLEALRTVLERELRSDLDEIPDDPAVKQQVFSETGELGFRDGFYRAHMTITVGFSASAIDALEVPPQLRPQDLAPFPWADLRIEPMTVEAGDVLLQVCADSEYVAEHVHRRVAHTLRGRLETVWSIAGTQRFTSRSGRASAGDARSLIGFLDGTSNLDPAHDDDDFKLVFIDPDNVPADYPPNPAPGPQPTPQPGQPGYGSGFAPAVMPELRQIPQFEPAWLKDATYLAVQAIPIDTARWDGETLGLQEQVMGRFKRSGASLDLADDDSLRDDPPAFATTPADTRVALTSHVRKSHPRALPEDEKRRVFRRGYPLIINDGASPVRRGLIFESFSRSTTTQIEFILKAWMFNEHFPHQGAGLDQLVAPYFQQTLCGGYYIVPPLEQKTDSSSWRIPPVG